MATPAATAELCAAPKSMQMENRKSPRKLSQNEQPSDRGDERRFARLTPHQCSMAIAADAEAQPGQQETPAAPPPSSSDRPT